MNKSLDENINTCQRCGTYQVPFYEGKLRWEIKWSHIDDYFAIFFYVKEDKKIMIYRRPISDDTLRAMLKDKKKIKKFVDASANSLMDLIKKKDIVWKPIQWGKY